MKNKATGFLKRIVSMLTSMAKAKSLALKNKTNALKARFIIMSLLRSSDVSLMSSISHKLQNALTGKQHKQHDEEDEGEGNVDGKDQSSAIVVYNRKLHNSMFLPEHVTYSEVAADDEEQDVQGYDEYAEDMEDKYPDLRHSLFELEDEDPGGSVIELVKKTKKEGEEFRLEDEIDQVADLFIRRFHKQMMLQKQQSLKRHREELLDD